LDIISVQDIRTRLAEIADRAQAGEEFMVTRHSRACFRITPPAADTPPSAPLVRETGVDYGERQAGHGRERSVTVDEAGRHFDRLLSELESGWGRIVIVRGGRAIADVVPHRVGDRLHVDPELAKVGIDCDLTQPLTDDLWED